MFDIIDLPGLLAVTMFFLSVGAVFIKTGSSNE
jgi:hypothetical protein